MNEFKFLGCSRHIFLLILLKYFAGYIKIDIQIVKKNSVFLYLKMAFLFIQVFLNFFFHNRLKFEVHFTYVKLSTWIHL